MHRFRKKAILFSVTTADKVGCNIKRVWTYLLDFWHRSNLWLILTCTACSFYGILLLNSADTTYGFETQVTAAVIGLVLALFFSQLDYRMLCRFWAFFWVPALLLVLLTFTPLGFNASGTNDTAWLGLPFGSSRPFITFQPSEFLKIAFIITFARHLHHEQHRLHRPITVLWLCAHAALSIALVFLQGDDGTAFVFICITLVMLFTAGVHWGYFAGLTAVSVPCAIVLWKTLDVQKLGRILALIFPEKYLTTYGWQQYRALMSIGSGGVFGVGYKNGGQVSLFARNNDFIFTEAAEEFGLIGAVVLLGLLLCVIWLLIHTAVCAEDPLGANLCFGVAGLIASQTIINIGMNLRLAPVIGITLPLFSAGGSAVVSVYLGIGLALSVWYQNSMTHKHIFKKRHKNGMSCK